MLPGDDDSSPSLNFEFMQINQNLYPSFLGFTTGILYDSFTFY